MFYHSVSRKITTTNARHFIADAKSMYTYIDTNHGLEVLRLFLEELEREGKLPLDFNIKMIMQVFSAAFFVYVAVNMSMVLGLLPIVGAPLPILSYGGSSMLAMMFGLGIVMSCNVYKNNAVG